VPGAFVLKEIEKEINSSTGLTALGAGHGARRGSLTPPFCRPKVFVASDS
jgi:hypothetical protein